MNMKYPLTESFSMTLNENHQEQTFILNSFSTMYEDTIVLASYLFGKVVVFLPHLVLSTVCRQHKLDNEGRKFSFLWID